MSTWSGGEEPEVEEGSPSPAPLYPPAAVPPPEEVDPAQEAGLPEGWPILPPGD